MSELATISVNQLAELDRQGNVEVIDVRTPAEFREVHAVLANNVPLDSLDPDEVIKHRKGSASDPLYVICRSGSRSANACMQFLTAGHSQVVNVDGGTLAWDEAGLPVVVARKPSRSNAKCESPRGCSCCSELCLACSSIPTSWVFLRLSVLGWCLRVSQIPVAWG